LNCARCSLSPRRQEGRVIVGNPSRPFVLLDSMTWQSPIHAAGNDATDSWQRSALSPVEVDSSHDSCQDLLPQVQQCPDTVEGSLSTMFESCALVNFPPPVDQVYAYIDHDSTSDVSSVSSDEESLDLTPIAPPHGTHVSVVPTRSIFARYWESNPTSSPIFCTAPANRSLSTTCRTSLGDNVFYGVHSISQDPPTHGGTNVPSSPSTRRRIFEFNVTEKVASSQEALLLSRENQLPLLRSLSSSTHTSTVQRSCLRSSRYAIKSTHREPSFSSFSDASVSFSPKVNVVVYARPAETWSGSNWAEYFA
jgi:hypothetical protein